MLNCSGVNDSQLWHTSGCSRQQLNIIVVNVMYIHGVYFSAVLQTLMYS